METGKKVPGDLIMMTRQQDWDYYSPSTLHRPQLFLPTIVLRPIQEKKSIKVT